MQEVITHHYTKQLIKNLATFYKGSGINCVHYKRILTIRLILPASMDLKEYVNSFFDDLAKLPEIPLEREMVYFWFCQEGNSDFYKKIINPTYQGELDWEMIGFRTNDWVPERHVKEHRIQRNFN